MQRLVYGTRRISISEIGIRIPAPPILGVAAVRAITLIIPGATKMEFTEEEYAAFPRLRELNLYSYRYTERSVDEIKEEMIREEKFTDITLEGKLTGPGVVEIPIEVVDSGYLDQYIMGLIGEIPWTSYDVKRIRTISGAYRTTERLKINTVTPGFVTTTLAYKLRAVASYLRMPSTDEIILLLEPAFEYRKYRV